MLPLDRKSFGPKHNRLALQKTRTIRKQREGILHKNVCRPIDRRPNTNGWSVHGPAEIIPHTCHGDDAEKHAEPSFAKRPKHVRYAPHLAAPSPMMENGAQNAG